MVAMELDGAEHVEHVFDEMEARTLNQTPAWEEAVELVQKGEQRYFAGKFVRTGALRASLTERGNDAIREAHAQELIFGSGIWYAGFQRKMRPAGTAGAKPRGRRRYGKSLVLKTTPTTRRAVGEMVMRYIASGDIRK
jgi:hypothetical protein